MSYKLNDWYLSSPTNVSPKEGDPVGSSDYIVFDVANLAASPFTYVYRGVSSPDNGNSVEIVADLSDEDSGTYLTMYIDDGVNRQGIRIYNGQVTLLDGSSGVTITNPAGEEHRYTISLKDGEFIFSFDKHQVITTSSMLSPVTGETRALVGFPGTQSGSYLAKFKYLKYAECVYTYVLLEDVDFEFQIDSAPTFDTVNLKTYTKSSFDNVTANWPDDSSADSRLNVHDAWDPVLYMCGSYVDESDSDSESGSEPRYDGNGIVHSVTIALPQKQDMSMPPFYYRVRFKGTYESDYSRSYVVGNGRVVPFEPNNPVYYREDGAVALPLPGYDFIYDESSDVVGTESITYTEADAGYHKLMPTAANCQVVLPEIPVPDNWKITFCNMGTHPITAKDNFGGTVEVIEAGTVRTFEFDTAGEKWYSYQEQDEAYFNIRPDVTSEIFKVVFRKRVPAEDYVYTKDYDSGNIATILHAEAREAAKFVTELQNQSAQLNIYQADNEDFLARWKGIYNLDESLFKNSAEMRDTFQLLIQNSMTQMSKVTMEELLTAVTGAAPDIIEYKDVIFNVLWSSEDYKSAPESLKFALYDDTKPSYVVNPFVLYDLKDKHATWQVKIYDPYNLQYSEELIKQIIHLYKPGWTKAIVDFYNAEGEPIKQRYYYWYNNYGEAAYNN